MSANSVRTGAATEPAVTNAGTDNSLTDPRVVEFNQYARPCIVTNHCVNAAIKVKVNAPASNDFDNDSDDDGAGYFIIAAGAHQDVSQEGRVAVKSVSFITQNASDDLDDVSVVGWLP